MSRTPTRLYSGTLAVGTAILYAPPTNFVVQVSNLSLVNKTAGVVTATVTITPLSGSAYNIAYQVNLYPNIPYIVGTAIGQVLNTGDAISALASANTSVDCVLSGFVTSI